MLYASLSNNVDIVKALSYPLSPIPFSLCHSDGLICKTTKSVIIQELIKQQKDDSDPPKPDISIFDGFYLMHTLKNVPDSFGKISKYIFQNLIRDRNEVNIICYSLLLLLL